MQLMPVRDEFDNTPDLKRSKAVHQFKIGRIKYNLPAWLYDGDGNTYSLYFTSLGGDLWEGGYKLESPSAIGEEKPIFTKNPTFNKVIIALHKAVKEIK